MDGHYLRMDGWTDGQVEQEQYHHQFHDEFSSPKTFPDLFEVRAELKGRQTLWNVGVFVDFLVEKVEILREVGSVEAQRGVVQLDGPLGDAIRRNLTASRMMIE